MYYYYDRVEQDWREGKPSRYCTEEQALKCMATNTPFNGSSMSATLREDGVYRVYSYATIQYAEFDGECIEWKTNWRSVTTHRHRALIRRIKGDRVDRFLSENEMEREDSCPRKSWKHPERPILRKE
jgi:hypothetical protein